MTGGRSSPSRPTSFDDPENRRALRKMKLVASGLFVAVTAVFVTVRVLGDGSGWVGYVEAAAEAAMVGALADWFAVTALFRHPLGLPIPHTAIVPRRKDEIGEGLGDFVQSNFLTGDVIADKLSSVQIGLRTSEWMVEESNVHALGDQIAVIASALSEVVSDDEDVRGLIEEFVSEKISGVRLAPLLGEFLDAAMDGGHHHEAYRATLSGAADFLEENRSTFRERLTQESPWWVPEPIDDRIFEKIYGAVLSFLRELDGNTQHHLRRDIDDRVRRLAERLKHDDELIERVERIKADVLAHPQFQAWWVSFWTSLQSNFANAVEDPESDLRVRLTDGVVHLGHLIRQDEALQHKIDGWVIAAAVHFADQGRAEIGSLISQTVESWDPVETSERIELQVGRDLQFIRINGTIVGGLVGLVIHALSHGLF